MSRVSSSRWLVLEIEVLQRVRIHDPDRTPSAESIEFLEAGTCMYGQLVIRGNGEEWILIPGCNSRGLPRRIWLEHWHDMRIEMKVLPGRKDYFDSTDSLG